MKNCPVCERELDQCRCTSQDWIEALSEVRAAAWILDKIAQDAS